MAEINLILKATNTDYVNKVKEAQRATQNLHDTAEKGMKREKGLIEDIEESLKELQEAKRKAYSVDDIEKYNKKINEAKLHLKEYEDAGVQANEKVAESGGKLAKVYAGIVAAIAAVASSMRILKNAVMETETGFNNFNVILAATKQLLYDILNKTPMKEWKKNMEEVAFIQANMMKLRAIERESLKDVAKYQVLYNKYLVDARDLTKSNEDRLKNYTYALTAHNRAIDIENENTATRLGLVREWLKTAPDNLTLLEEESALTIKLYGIEEKRYASKKELNSMMTGLVKAGIEAELKTELDGQKKWRDKYEDHLKLQSKQKTVWAIKDSTLMKRIQIQTADAQKEIGKELDEYDKKQKQAEIDRVKEAEEAKLELKKQAWDTIIASEQAVFGIIANITDQNLEKELAALDKETEMKVKAAKDDANKINSIETLAALQRIEIEKEYSKKQKQIAIAQSLIDTAQSVIKAYMSQVGIPVVGPALATKAATYAAIFGALQTALIVSQKFAKGGWTGKGGMRDDTGERVAGIVHEEEFVTKKGPAAKYRGVLEAINKDDRKLMVNRFTKIMPENIIAPVNNINVDNNGSNNRLDRVNNKLTQISRQLEPRRQTSREVVEMGNSTIVRKGTNTRTVKR